MSSPLHHYVPQFLLKRFGRGKTHQIFVFDKQTGKTFSGAANKLAAERKFYDFEFKGVPLTMEPALAELESEMAKCAEAILKLGRLAVKEPTLFQERNTITHFLSVQMVRTAGALARATNLGDKLKAELRERGMPEAYFQPPPELGNADNAAKALLASRIRNASKDLGPALLEKDWLLMKTNPRCPFLLGDHPVVLYNYLGGKLGVAVPGVVVYFPLSPEYALGLHCPSIAEQIRKQQEKLDRFSDGVFAAHPEVYEDSVDIMQGFVEGIPLQSKPENVEHFNSVQISNAERFVFSSDGNVALVEEMLRAEPQLRAGPRAEIKRGT
jgi:hypothetical protein